MSKKRKRKGDRRIAIQAGFKGKAVISKINGDLTFSALDGLKVGDIINVQECSTDWIAVIPTWRQFHASNTSSPDNDYRTAYGAGWYLDIDILTLNKIRF